MITRSLFIIILAPAVLLALLTGCKRESRAFDVPPSATFSPESIPYQNALRPGPSSVITASALQPATLNRRIREPYAFEFSNNGQALSDGQRLYEGFNCVGCHAHGGGGMAPPLLDNKWFYGSDPQQVYTSILAGRPNGMPSFRGRIPDFQIWELAAYVRSLSGQANPNSASGREDHMSVQPPPNSIPPEKPITIPEPTTGPATRAVGP